MMRRVVNWGRGHWLVVALVLVAAGLVGFDLLIFHFATRALPALQPVIVAVVAQAPAASAEEVERQITIPLEVTLAGIPGLKATYSRSQMALSRLDCEFEPGVGRDGARQEVINRLQFVQNLPPGVNPQLGASPPFLQGNLRYTLSSPRDALGHDVYTPGDLATLQYWVLERHFRRVPGVYDVSGHGGVVKRYEIYPDPDRLKRYGITLQQLQDGIDKGNANFGGTLPGEQNRFQILSRGLIGGGLDPMEKAAAMMTPQEAAAYLRAEENRRSREFRDVVLTSINNVPVRVDDVVEVEPPGAKQGIGNAGVVVGHYPRLGQASVSRPQRDEGGTLRRDAKGDVAWIIEPDVVQGLVLKRWNVDAAQWLPRVLEQVNECNMDPRKLLPGVKLVTYPGPEVGFFIHGLFPAAMALDAISKKVMRAHAILRGLPEVDAVVSEIGLADTGTAATLPNQVEMFIPLKPEAEWPAPDGCARSRSRSEILEDMHRELTRKLPDAAWTCSPHPDLGSLEPFVAGGDEHLVKVFGPDLAELEKLALQVKQKLEAIQGIGNNVRLFPIMGQSTVEFRVDRDQCKRWGVSVAEITLIVEMATNGKTVSRMVEGEKLFDICLRWNAMIAGDLKALLALRVNPTGQGPRLGDLITPLRENAKSDPQGRLSCSGPACIYRERGQRLISLKFQIKGRGAAGALAEAQAATAALFRPPYHAEWLGP